MNINPPLKPGDRIILLSMHGETMAPGLKGVVTRIQSVVGTDVMYVDWENGRTLALLSDTDAWTLDESEPIQEAYNNEWLSKNLDIANFDTNTLVEFLLKVKESGITNMFGAAPYLWMGRERIEHQFEYHDFNDEKQEKFDEMLDMANEAQSAMINGVIKILEKEKKDLSVETINRYLQKYSQKLLMHYVNVLS
jgi:hypothetical protein